MINMSKKDIQAFFNAQAQQRPKRFRQNDIYHSQVIDTCRKLIDDDSRVLELGCSTGDLFEMLQPKHGVGVDISPKSIAIAKQNHPQYKWIQADIEALPDDPALSEPFDLIILSDVLGYVDDVQQLLQHIRHLITSKTFILVSTWNWLWQPVLQVAERLDLKVPDIYTKQNWLSATALRDFLELEDYKVIAESSHLFLPLHIPVVSPLMNSVAQLPILKRLPLLQILVARPAPIAKQEHLSVTVVIPTRNEAGNIKALIERTPEMGSHTELLFIDGNSTDGTVEEIHHQIELHPERDIKFMPQVPPQSPDVDTPANLMLKLGKGDAVRKAFDAASCDVLMILDSDVSVLPEDLEKFYDAIATRKGQFINGTRFIYPQQQGAMKFLNKLGNVFFSLAFSWLLNRKITDTLCGTKVLYKQDYEKIKANRDYFGDFDPFGDFDLLFGAAWLGLDIVEVPVHYQARTYGESKVRVNLHGPLLGRMSLIALQKFKIEPLINNTNRQADPTASTQTKHQGNRGLWIGLAIITLILFLFRKKK